jgi:hypothetical protein
MLPHLEHPDLGPLTGSTADYHQNGIRQTGHKPGTVGHPLPGVALRVTDNHGVDLPADALGVLLARVHGRSGWLATGYKASIDRDGFIRVEGGGGGRLDDIDLLDGPPCGDDPGRLSKADPHC